MSHFYLPDGTKNRNIYLNGSNSSIYDSNAGPAIRLTLRASVYMPRTFSLDFLSSINPAEVIMLGIIAPNASPATAIKIQTVMKFENSIIPRTSVNAI